jgi:hypothetical protein
MTLDDIKWYLKKIDNSTFGINKQLLLQIYDHSRLGVEGLEDVNCWTFLNGDKKYDTNQMCKNLKYQIDCKNFAKYFKYCHFQKHFVSYYCYMYPFNNINRIDNKLIVDNDSYRFRIKWIKNDDYFCSLNSLEINFLNQCRCIYNTIDLIYVYITFCQINVINDVKIYMKQILNQLFNQQLSSHIKVISYAYMRYSEIDKKIFDCNLHFK